MPMTLRTRNPITTSPAAEVDEDPPLSPPAKPITKRGRSGNTNEAITKDASAHEVDDEEFGAPSPKRRCNTNRAAATKKGGKAVETTSKKTTAKNGEANQPVTTVDRSKIVKFEYGPLPSDIDSFAAADDAMKELEQQYWWDDHVIPTDMPDETNPEELKGLADQLATAIMDFTDVKEGPCYSNTFRKKAGELIGGHGYTTKMIYARAWQLLRAIIKFCKEGFSLTKWDDPSWDCSTNTRMLRDKGKCKITAFNKDTGKYDKEETLHLDSYHVLSFTVRFKLICHALRKYKLIALDVVNMQKHLESVIIAAPERCFTNKENNQKGNDEKADKAAKEKAARAEADAKAAADADAETQSKSKPKSKSKAEPKPKSIPTRQTAIIDLPTPASLIEDVADVPAVEHFEGEPTNMEMDIDDDSKAAGPQSPSFATAANHEDHPELKEAVHDAEPHDSITGAADPLLEHAEQSLLEDLEVDDGFDAEEELQLSSYDFNAMSPTYDNSAFNSSTGGFSNPFDLSSYRFQEVGDDYNGDIIM